MNELIKIEEKGGIDTVNARELHEFLESKRQFGNWIKQRIEKYGFIEEVDFTSFNENVKRGTGASVRKEYYISIDMAKELSMVENNDRGREARRYFIECEKKLHDNGIPSDPKLLLAKAVMEAQAVIAENEKAMLEMKPKVDFYDTVIDSPSTMKMGDVAKLLSIKGYGQNNLYAFLKRKGVLMQDKKPYQRFVEAGYFKSNEYMYINEYGEQVPGFTTVVFQKGVDYIKKLIEKEEASKK